MRGPARNTSPSGGKPPGRPIRWRYRPRALKRPTDGTPIDSRRGPTYLSLRRGGFRNARARTRARTKARERDSISRRSESARARCTLLAHHLATRRVTRRGSRIPSRHGQRLPDRACRPSVDDSSGPEQPVTDHTFRDHTFSMSSRGTGEPVTAHGVR